MWQTSGSAAVLGRHSRLASYSERLLASEQMIAIIITTYLSTVQPVLGVIST